MGKLSAINKIEWRDIDVSDVDFFENIGQNAEGIAMFSFCSMFLWKGYYGTKISVVEGNLVAKGVSDSGRNVIYFPRGLSGDWEKTLDAVVSGCEGSLLFMPMPESVCEKVCAHFGIKDPVLLEGKSEYVYLQSDLALLAGKKFHAKRNHIAKFNKNYVGEYIEITPDNLYILKECAEHIFRVIENSPENEYRAIMTAIDNFETLKLRACVITVDGKYVAYSIGSVINADTADIHFEKADRSYEGSYAYVNNCFAKYGFPDMTYINREEDLGIEGLRKAKLSYNPYRLNRMYKASL